MKTKVTFFPNKYITQHLISATGFDMLHHIFALCLEFIVLSLDYR